MASWQSPITTGSTGVTRRRVSPTSAFPVRATSAAPRMSRMPLGAASDRSAPLRPLSPTNPVQWDVPRWLLTPDALGRGRAPALDGYAESRVVPLSRDGHTRQSPAAMHWIGLECRTANDEDIFTAILRIPNGPGEDQGDGGGD